MKYIILLASLLLQSVYGLPGAPVPTSDINKRTIKVTKQSMEEIQKAVVEAQKLMDAPLTIESSKDLQDYVAAQSSLERALAELKEQMNASPIIQSLRNLIDNEPATDDPMLNRDLSSKYSHEELEMQRMAFARLDAWKPFAYTTELENVLRKLVHDRDESLVISVNEEEVEAIMVRHNTFENRSSV
jgi:hypothetical protein